jgi:hypothetical protein
MSDAELERVADRVFEKFKSQIGDSAIKFAIWAVGLALMVFLTWAGLVKSSHAKAILFHLPK